MRPMLAATVSDATIKDLVWPMFGSPKIDGIRAITYRGGLISRSMKPIPNRKVQALFSHHLAMYLDGELTAGKPSHLGVFNKTSSQVMTHGATAEGITFHVFDSFKDPLLPYIDRFAYATKQVSTMQELGFDSIVILPQTLLKSVEEMEIYERMMLDEGYEGIMLRAPRAGYKFNRSTLREQILVKLKRFVDDEAIVIGYDELMSNQNEATVSETGYQVRSSHKDGMVPMDTLGALIVDWHGHVLNIGTGFTAAQRAQLWSMRNELRGRLVKFRYQSYGMKDVPRLPVFLGFRSKLDL